MTHIIKSCKCGNLLEKSHTLKSGVINYKNNCRTCRGRIENKDRKHQISKQYYLDNRDMELKKYKQWRIDNPEKVKNYNMSSKDKRNIYHKNRIKFDINYKLTKYLRSRLSNAVKNDQRSGSAIKDLGCSVKYLKQYLETKFKPGMTWDNYGKWHIDHIRPLSSFTLTDYEEFKKACHYTNLQPLWAKDNIRKSNKVIGL